MPEQFIQAIQAYATTKSNDFAKWPIRSQSGNRLFPECTPHYIPKFTLKRGARVFAIGSCFARNLEQYLIRLGIEVASYNIEFPKGEMSPRSRRNDLIIKYTPPSILQELRYALDPTVKSTEQLQYIVELKNGLAVDLNLPTWFSGVPRQRAIERRLEINKLFSEIQSSDLIIITLGLIECWYDKVAGGFICDAPSPDLVQEYPDRFVFKQLNYAEALSYTQSSIDLIKKANPSARIVITTSPVPLGRTFTDSDVIVANNYSKSMLRTVAGELTAGSSDIDYYPSYEMVMMSDNAASWHDDLRHVTDAKVWEVVMSFAAKIFPETQDSDALLRQRYAQASVKLGKREFSEAYAILTSLKAELGADTGFLNVFLPFCRTGGTPSRGAANP